MAKVMNLLIQETQLNHHNSTQKSQLHTIRQLYHIILQSTKSNQLTITFTNHQLLTLKSVIKSYLKNHQQRTQALQQALNKQKQIINAQSISVSKYQQMFNLSQKQVDHYKNREKIIGKRCHDQINKILRNKVLEEISHNYICNQPYSQLTLSAKQFTPSKTIKLSTESFITSVSSPKQKQGKKLLKMWDKKTKIQIIESEIKSLVNQKEKLLDEMAVKTREYQDKLREVSDLIDKKKHQYMNESVK